MELALGIFILTYALLLLLPNLRAYIALGSGVLFVVLGILPITEVVESVEWNVLMMIAGTMGIVSLFIDSQMPSLLADLILKRTKNVKWAIIALSLFAGIISAFVDNVATVLMIAPVALNISKKLKISPVASIISIAVASNLQGAATLVGDTTSILLGEHAGMDFFDFFFFQGKIGMFFVVQLGAICATIILYFVFKKYNQPILVKEKTVVNDYFPTILLLGMVILLIVASFLPKKPENINGIICLVVMIIGIVRDLFKYGSVSRVIRTLKDIDYFTLLLLGGLFLVIAGITKAGVVDKISILFVSIAGDNIFVIYSLIVWASVLFSAFIDNIPYILTMLPVVTGISTLLNIDPYLLYFGLLTGATLGGNLTPIGASANITALGILRKDGYKVSTLEFMKIGVPFTLAAVISGYLMIWLLWK